MTELLSPPQAARLIGVNVHQVKEWMRRGDDPLPSVPVGSSGKFRKVLREQIAEWLEREAGRSHSPKTRPRRPRR
jgi:transposase